MDVVTTSLEALIQRATNPLNDKPDVAAIEAFCVVLGKEPKGVQVACRLLATHIQSSVEKEALQALVLLDTCMKRCGRPFHAEIGKFRFLNVLIKLVSPKYLGNETAVEIRHKILELLQAWIKDYPKEVKIKETYEMLKKQGVIKDSVPPAQNIPDSTSKPVRSKNPIFEDEEKTKLLQKLLRSTDPFNVSLANKLIKSMVRDDEKRLQQNCQRNMELESVHANVKLLSEMLDSYDREKSSSEDVDLMKELHEACERLKPTVTRLAYESQDNDEMIGEVLAANDELSQVFEKYASVMILGRGISHRSATANNEPSTSLLDLSSPMNSTIRSCRGLNQAFSEPPPTDPKSDMEMLGDIFSSLGNTTLESPSSTIHDAPVVYPATNIMQPISIVQTLKPAELPNSIVKLDSKAQALEDLNQLGETLLKQSLSQGTTVLTKNSFGNVSKTTKDTTISVKTGQIPSSMRVDPCSPKDSIIDVTIDAPTNDKASTRASNGLGDELSSNDKDIRESAYDFVDLLNNDDDVMLDASLSPPQIVAASSSNNDKVQHRKPEKSVLVSSAEVEIKPLTDIHVTIDSIKPGTIQPVTVIEEKNGISVVLHFAKGSPREDVMVMVVTTMSKNPKALSNYLFQAVVPKRCKCRLQPPSGTELPGHNPFLPPSAITQIMLIANPQKEPVSLKFMLSYTIEDEIFTEMGEVDRLPVAD